MKTKKVKIKNFDEATKLEKKHKNKDLNDKVAIIKDDKTLRGLVVQQDKIF